MKFVHSIPVSGRVTATILLLLTFKKDTPSKDINSDPAQNMDCYAITAEARLESVSLQGVHKIVKKHDKLLPHAPCQQFYISHLHQQPWVQVRGPPSCHLLSAACGLVCRHLAPLMLS